MISRRPVVQRLLIGAFAIATCTALGVRSRPTQASPWVDSKFKGPARAALTIHDSVRADVETAPPPFDVFASTVYGTEVSRFGHGIYLKTTFIIPNSEDKAVLIVDLNRTSSRTAWSGDEGAYLYARYYTVSPQTGQIYFDAHGTGGEVQLEKIAIAAESIGFRIRGFLELTDPGDDRIMDTEDDGVTEIELVFETIPPPEAIAAGAPQPSPLPSVDYCEWPDCYEDPGYYYDPYDAYYDPSCGNTSVGYSYYDYDDGTGCDGGDTVVENDDPSAFDDTTWDTDTSDGCSSDSSDSSYYDDSSYDGCEGSSDSSSSSGGCDSSTSSSSSSSGCSDSGSSSSSGCGGSGCEGDTFDEAPVHQTETLQLEGLLGWGPMLLLLGLVLGIHRRKE
ncbi:MAG: hypothetical protein EP329_12170 [Deltaproteobacteria bacterium]|nr:MAG: hypothetical protein EP329_12170 [Deltaproteobacteria bacterium]